MNDQVIKYQFPVYHHHFWRGSVFTAVCLFVFLFIGRTTKKVIGWFWWIWGTDRFRIRDDQALKVIRSTFWIFFSYFIDSSVVGWYEKWKWSWENQLQHSARKFRLMYLLRAGNDSVLISLWCGRDYALYWHQRCGNNLCLYFYDWHHYWLSSCENMFNWLPTTRWICFVLVCLFVYLVDKRTTQNVIIEFC